MSSSEFFINQFSNDVFWFVTLTLPIAIQNSISKTPMMTPVTHDDA